MVKDYSAVNPGAADTERYCGDNGNGNNGYAFISSPVDGVMNGVSPLANVANELGRISADGGGLGGLGPDLHLNMVNKNQ